MNHRIARRPGGSWRWGILALLLIAPFLVWPLGALLWRAAAPHDALSGSVFRAVAGDRFYWGRLGFTVAEATASLALSVAIGLPAAYVFSALRFPAQRLLRGIVELPLLVPALVLALAFRELLAPNGWVNDLLARAGAGPVDATGTLWVILAAHVCFGVAVFVRVVGAAWPRLDAAREEAAAMLGADRRRVFRHVTLPALAPALRAAAAIVFVFAFSSFAIVLVLGRPGLETLEVVIFRSATRTAGLESVALLALVQVIALAAALLVVTRGGAANGVAVGGRGPGTRRLREAGWRRGLLAGVVLLVVVPLVLAPLAALVHGAFSAGAAGALTAANFAHLFDSAGAVTAAIAPLDAIRWSATFALGAAAIATVAGTAAAVAIARAGGAGGALLTGLLRLPLAVPAVSLAFAYLLTFHQGWRDLRGSPWLVLLAHALVAYPFVVRGVLAAQRAYDARLADAARMLGGSAWGVWRTVEAARTVRAMLTGAAIAGAISLGEFGATSLLQRREFATVPIAIYEALGQPNTASLGRALALATLLLAACAVVFALSERLRTRSVEGI